MTASHEDAPAPTRILQHLETVADRLGEGSAADHVRRSVRELSLAVEHSGSVGPAVERVMSSIRQLQGEECAGRLRHAREALAVAERVLNTVQQELLPALHRSGHV
ncbi:MAG TPA: hypothetical protein VHH91_09980 [Vicinamibacterales bacterium]|nr:hypothetical protein [Vicinamibacterales bacterium]